MGNIDALRDWGHAKDFVRMQWLMLQQDHPEDFCIATGKQYSVRQFIEKTATALGMQIRWEGKGVNEVGYWTNLPKAVIASAAPVIASEARQSMTPESMDCHVVPPRNDESRGARNDELQPIIRIDPRYFRPTEVETLLGDPTKAKQKLGWVPEITLDEMITEMAATDLAEAKKHALLKLNGYTVNVSVE